MALEGAALILLAAGRSERFGDGPSKLDQNLGGLALGLHVAERLAPLPFLARIAITGRAVIDYAAHKFETIQNPDPRRGMSSSIALGVARAIELGATDVLIALADMPMVDAGHVRRLFATEGDVVASFDGIAAKPPVRFAASRFDDLLALNEEAGARALLRGAKRVAPDPADLVDVDTPADLERLRQTLSEPGAVPPVRLRDRL